MNPTLSGLLAIGMWSLLAAMTVETGDVPPLQLLAMTFLIGGLAGSATWLVRGVPTALFRLPAAVWIVGIAGLFGYHFFYYTALRNAPPAQASLIAFLWPMLIVAGSALLPGERLRWFHVLGAALGFTGAALIVSRDGLFTGTGSFLGYASALACAVIWSTYSVLSRTLKSAPTDVVAINCLATAVMAAFSHLIFEATLWPQTANEWLAVAGLGLMPVGIAFYAWDFGMKHGNIQFLGSASYLAPLISTLVLIAAGYAEPELRLLAACLLITFGAVIATGRLTPDR